MLNFEIRLQKILKLAKILSLTGLMISMFSTSEAVAAKYECTTKQAFTWEQGNLKPRSFFKNALVQFDDEESKIWIANDSRSPFSAIPAKIIVPAGPNNDLVVSGDATVERPDGIEAFVGHTILRIRGWSIGKDHEFKKESLNFFLYVESLGTIYIGGCAVKPQAR